MKLNLIPVLVAGLFAAAPAFSATIDFENATLNYGDSIGSFYSNLGVTFGADALEVKNDGLGQYTGGNYFFNAPSALGVMSPFAFDVASDSTMSVASGFSGVVSFYFSTPSTTSVRILDANGTVLTKMNLSANFATGGETGYDTWTLASYDLGSNVAKSITFGDAANVAAFDNITISAVPEPSEALLLSLGLGMMAGVASVRRNRTAK